MAIPTATVRATAGRFWLTFREVLDGAMYATLSAVVPLVFSVMECTTCKWIFPWTNIWHTALATFLGYIVIQAPKKSQLIVSNASPEQTTKIQEVVASKKV